MAFMIPSTSYMNNQPRIPPLKRTENANENIPFTSEDFRIVFEQFGHNNHQQNNSKIQEDSTPSYIFQSKRKKITNENLPINSVKVRNDSELSRHDNYQKYNSVIQDKSKWIDYVSIDKNVLISVFINDSRGSLRDLLARLINLSLELELSPAKFLKFLQKVDSYDKFHILPITRETLWKVLECKDFQMIEYYYCNECPYEYHGIDNRRISTLQRPQCPDCAKVRRKYLGSTLSSFLSIDLYSQIKHLFSIPGVYQSLQYPFNRKYRYGVHRDIYDAFEYRSLRLKNRFLDFPDHFTLTVNISAYKIGNSSTMKAWPIYVQINEFSQHLRERYMLLAGIYVGDRPPKMDKFVAPLKTQLQQLCDVGILWRTTEGMEIRSKFMTIMWSVDPLTHSNILKMNQCDEYRKLINYYIQSKNPLLSKYSMPLTLLEERFNTHREIQNLPSSMYYQLIVEPMDILFLGVAKQHMKIMMENPSASYYIGSEFHCSVIDDTLLKIKLPKCCHANPRSISNWNEWSIHEWKHWLGYAPVCLDGIIDVKYIHHLSLLSEAVEILISNDAASRDLVSQQPRVDDLFKKYILLLNKYFGVQTMSYEVYLLTQITFLAEKWGPLSSFSGLRCESWNKKILHRKIMNETITRVKYTTNTIIDDIITLYLKHKYMTCNNLDSLLTKSSKKLIACMKRAQTEPYTHSYQDKIKSIETTWPMEPTLTPSEESFLKKENFPSALSFYNKIKKNGIEFQPYNTDDSIFCNSTIATDQGEYGMIRHIISYQYDNETVYKICIQKFRHVQNAFGTQYISEVVLTEKFVNLNIENILPAVKIMKGRKTYVYKYLPD